MGKTLDTRYLLGIAENAEVLIITLPIVVPVIQHAQYHDFICQNVIQEKNRFFSNPVDLPPSPLQSDSVLPACSTTLKRLERPSLRPFRTGLSLVVVERAQAEPPPPLMGLCWRLHRLRSLEEEVASNLEVEPTERTVVFSQKTYIEN